VCNINANFAGVLSSMAFVFVLSLSNYNTLLLQNFVCFFIEIENKLITNKSISLQFIKLVSLAKFSNLLANLTFQMFSFRT